MDCSVGSRTQTIKYGWYLELRPPHSTSPVVGGHQECGWLVAIRSVVSSEISVVPKNWQAPLLYAVLLLEPQHLSEESSRCESVFLLL